jgi:DNA polymerase III alpha subunit
MIQNKFGELIFSESDVIDLLMHGHDPSSLGGMIVDNTVKLESWPNIIDPVPDFYQQRFHNCTVPEFHAQQQSNWHMPEEYKNLDIAVHVLGLCQTQEQLQRCGQELLLYQERDLFDLLRYLKYLVDVMTENHIIWGVGRGSSVASYVLYKLGVHRIDSMYYNLDPEEFLR